MPGMLQDARKSFQRQRAAESELVDSFQAPQCTTASSCSLIFFYMLAPLPGTTCCSPSGLLLLLSVFLLFSLHSSSVSLSPVAQTMGPRLQPAVGPLKPSESFQSEAQGLQGKSYNLACWCASVGMPMSAGIATLFIHSLLSFVLQCASLHDCILLYPPSRLTCFFWLFELLIFFLCFGTQRSVECSIFTRCPPLYKKQSFIV